MANHFQTIDALPAADVERLRRLGEGELRVEVWRQFTDDQDQCLEVEVNGVKLALWWIGPRSAAAFYFVEDSPSARAMALRVIRREIDLCEQAAEPGAGPDPARQGT